MIAGRCGHGFARGGRSPGTTKESDRMRVSNPLREMLCGRVLALGLALITSTASAAPDPQDAQRLIEQSTGEMLEVLRSEAEDGEVDLERVRGRLRELVLPHLDFLTMTKLAIGRSWLQADREQKRALVEEFRDLLVRTYTRALEEYDDQELEFLPLEPGSKEGRVTVRSRVVPADGGTRIPVEYSLRYHADDDRWQVYDIEVDGVSLVTTYRSSFSDIISREGVEGLIEHLREKNADKAVQTPS